MKLVTSHMQERLSDPGRYARTGRRIMADLLAELAPQDLGDVPDEEVSTEVRRRHDVIISTLSLFSMASALRECEYYFRRYPFAGLPPTRADHLRNCIEMYFDRIAQFRDRLKRTLNAMKRFNPAFVCDIGTVLKDFDKTFRFELRSRNHVHHHGRFDDKQLSQLSLLQLLAPTMPELAAVIKEKSLYREGSRNWIERVRDRTKTIYFFVEHASGLLVAAIQDRDARAKENATYKS